MANKIMAEEIISKNINSVKTQIKDLNEELNQLNTIDLSDEELRSYIKMDHLYGSCDSDTLRVAYIFLNSSIELGKRFIIGDVMYTLRCGGDNNNIEAFRSVKDLLCVNYNPKEGSLGFPFADCQPDEEDNGEEKWKVIKHNVKLTKPNTKLLDIIDNAGSIPLNVDDAVKSLFNRLGLKENNVMICNNIGFNRNDYSLAPKDEIEKTFVEFENNYKGDIEYFINKPVKDSVISHKK